MLDDRFRAIDDGSVQIEQNSPELMPLHWRSKRRLSGLHDGGGSGIVVEPKIIQMVKERQVCTPYCSMNDASGWLLEINSRGEIRLPLPLYECFQHL